MVKNSVAFNGIIKKWHVFSLLILFSGGSAACAADRAWELSGSATYESINYGTNQKAYAAYFPFTLKRSFTRCDISLTVPYIYKKRTSFLTVIDGRFYQIRQGQPGITPSNYGLGDAEIRGSYDLLSEDDNYPIDLSIAAMAKFPTASQHRGFGTGKFDEGLGLELSRTYGPWKFHTDINYIFVGSPAGLYLKNQFAFEAGVGRKITSRLTGGVYYAENTPINKGSSNFREIAANIGYNISKESHLFAGGTIEASPSNPDYSITVGAGTRF